jgi:hypothetical protein
MEKWFGEASCILTWTLECAGGQVMNRNSCRRLTYIMCCDLHALVLDTVLPTTLHQQVWCECLFSYSFFKLVQNALFVAGPIFIDRKYLQFHFGQVHRRYWNQDWPNKSIMAGILTLVSDYAIFYSEFKRRYQQTHLRQNCWWWQRW